MLDWLKKIKSKKNSSPLLYLNAENNGFGWHKSESIKSIACDALALPILQQLESDGLVIENPDESFSASWENVYTIIKHSEYQLIVNAICLPKLKKLAPSLESINSFGDTNFAISIVGWTNENGSPVRISSVQGPLIYLESESFLMPEASWRVQHLVNVFNGRPESDRNDIANRRHWGLIRQAAIQAGSQLSDFLYRVVVLTPEKLLIDLNRVDVLDSKVVEVIPSFVGCPKEWLNQFDRFKKIPDCFDIPTPEGIVQVLVTSAVKTVLEQIKNMPGRRVAGAKAEAFLLNPFSALGEDACATIDVEQFEQARVRAKLVFDQFSAFVQRDPIGNPQRVGLKIVSTQQNPYEDNSNNDSIEWFHSEDELEKFIQLTEKRLNQGLQISAWLDYEFELLGDTQLELQILREALSCLRKGPLQLTLAQVYDLSSYSNRIEKIGMQPPFYSAYIAKKEDKEGEEGWFPDNLVPLMAWKSQETGEQTCLPLTPEFEKTIKNKINDALQNGSEKIHIPSLPHPVSIAEAQDILQAFTNFSNSPKNFSDEPISSSETQVKSRKAPTLVLKTNIEMVSYEESRRELLASYSTIPDLPKTLLDGVTLKLHQLVGVAWLQHLFLLSPHGCRGAVLADDMGLGKTLQLLTLLAWAFEKDPHLPPALIVAPVALLENWQEEAVRFFKKNSLPIAMIYGEALKALRLPRSAIDEQLVKEGLVKFLRAGWVGNAKIVLTTYETLRELEFSFAAEKWSVMICDEAQKIKNPNALVTRAAKKQNVRFKVACTGTPIENTLIDLWCLFDFVQSGLLGSLNTFAQNYRKPSEDTTEANKMRIDELRAIISPQILRRTKKEVAKDLPEKLIDNMSRSLIISDYQMQLYSQAVDLFRRRKELDVRKPFKNHFGLLHYLRKLCTDPHEPEAQTSLIHELAQYRTLAPKMHWLLNKLHEIKNKDEKVLIFCEFKGLQRLLCHYIEKIFGFRPDIINGDTSASTSHQQSRQKRIRLFQEKIGFNVIVLSPIAVGFGVNIQAANHVVHYTRTWNPAKEDQATDRAYRIGQTKNVHVYCPVVVANEFKTFDAKLDELLEEKRKLSDDMLNGSGDVTASDFSVDDVIPTGEKITSPLVLDDVFTLQPTYVEGLAAVLWQEVHQYQRVFLTAGSGDNGVDVVAIKNNDGVLIQCKSSTDVCKELGWDAVKEVVGGKAFYSRAYPGINFSLVAFTNQRWNSQAKEHASLNSVELIDQDDIAILLSKSKITIWDIEKILHSSWVDSA